MCIFSLDQTKLWVIIFIIIKQSPMCISRICVNCQNRILVGNGILLGNPLHYIPVKRELLLHKLRELRYEDIKIMNFPACVQREDVDEADWYCVIARKGE